MSRVRQAVLLVDGQVVFLGVRRPTLRLIRLKMSEIILTGSKTQIKKGEKMKIKKKRKKIVKKRPWQEQKLGR